MARKIEDNTVKIGLVILIVALIFYMLLSFGGTNMFAVVNIEGKDTVLSGDDQTYFISLRTVNPEQFITEVHYREQFGRWRLETSNGTILSPGKEVKLALGAFQQYVTINIPYEQEQIHLIAEIIEFQYSAPSPGGEFLRSDESLRVQETLVINIAECQGHADCNIPGMCLGEFGFCTENLCEVRGECKECITNEDCEEEGYVCLDFECIIEEEPTFIDEFKESFREPITEPAPVLAGEPPRAKQAPAGLTVITFGLFALVVYLLFIRKKK